MQQARVGILRNPATPGLPQMPRRDVWRKWPRLRSSRRPPGTGTQTGAAAAPHPTETHGGPLPDGTMLDGFRRALRQPCPPPSED